MSARKPPKVISRAWSNLGEPRRDGRLASPMFMIDACTGGQQFPFFCKDIDIWKFWYDQPVLVSYVIRVSSYDVSKSPYQR